jgi:hypothetical protein
MRDPLETRLIEALKSVDAHGDVALTGTGRRRITAGIRAPGTVVSFRNRGSVGGGPLHRQTANANLKE